MTQAMESTVRYIHTFTELSWPGSWRGQWDTFILRLSYHNPGRGEDSEIHSYSHWAIMTRAVERTVRYIHPPTELSWLTRPFPSWNFPYYDQTDSLDNAISKCSSVLLHVVGYNHAAVFCCRCCQRHDVCYGEQSRLPGCHGRYFVGSYNFDKRTLACSE